MDLDIPTDPGLRPRPVRVPVLETGRADGKGPLFGRVRDLSRSGLFLETERLLAPGTQVTVRFELPFRTADGDARAVVEALGEVRRRRRAPAEGSAEADPCTQGVGVRFLRLSREDELVVQAFVERGGAELVVSEVAPAVS